MRQLLDWERAAIVDAMRDGEKRDAIASEFNVSRSYPSILARRKGIDARSPGRPSTKRLHVDKPVLTT